MVLYLTIFLFIFCCVDKTVLNAVTLDSVRSVVEQSVLWENIATKSMLQS